MTAAHLPRHEPSLDPPAWQGLPDELPSAADAELEECWEAGFGDGSEDIYDEPGPGPETPWSRMMEDSYQAGWDAGRRDAE